MTDRAAWWAPANGFQPRSEPGVHLAARKIHASRRSGKRCRNPHRDPLGVRPRERSRRLRQVSPLRGRSDCITVRLGRSGGRRHCRRSGIHGSARRFSTSARRSDRRWPFTARIFQALPRVAHRGGMASGRPAITGSPVGSPVLKLWNESRTNRARIADSLHVRFRSRPHIVADQSPTTKSCNRPDTIAAARASTR